MLSRSRIVSRDLSAARRFYSAAGRPLGLAVVEVQDDGFSLCSPSDTEHPLLRVKSADAVDRATHEEPETRPTHLAFEAPDDFTVRAFYRAALEAGGTQAGYPAPQPTGGRYSYYAAKVIDPDGNCIECGWRH
jgi:catechol 2,3-dioxygenase-like lactoylglutathione lyase family enzyme